MANVSMNGAKIVYQFLGALCETTSRVVGWHARTGRPPTKFHSGNSTFNIQSHVHRREIWSDHLHVSILNGKKKHLTLQPARHIMWRARLGEPIGGFGARLAHRRGNGIRRDVVIGSFQPVFTVKRVPESESHEYQSMHFSLLTLTLRLSIRFSIWAGYDITVLSFPQVMKAHLHIQHWCSCPGRQDRLVSH